MINDSEVHLRKDSQLVKVWNLGPFLLVAINAASAAAVTGLSDPLLLSKPSRARREMMRTRKPDESITVWMTV